MIATARRVARSSVRRVGALVAALTVTPEEQASGVLRKIWRNPINGSYLCEVDFTQCIVKTGYQRGLCQRWSDTLASAWEIFSPMALLNCINGALDVVDGQHRVKSVCKLAKQKGVPAIGYAFVTFGLQKKEAARIYNVLNYTKRPDTWNLFASRVIGEYDDTTNQVAVCSEFDLTLKCHVGDGADLLNTFPIKKAYRNGVLVQWCKVMNVFRSSDGRLEKLARKGASEFQKGVEMLVRKYGTKITSVKALKAFRSIGMDLIQFEANRRCDCARTNMNHYFAAMENLLELRNII
jgi:hypothetical protein